jgi:hypothetical protein
MVVFFLIILIYQNFRYSRNQFQEHAISLGEIIHSLRIVILITII